jgi:DNA-binding transcriptional MerR regulator
MALTVSALAGQAGLSADTVRYYERVGLLPEPARSAAGYRLYDQDAVGRLRLIRGAQRAGLRLREIGELLQSPTRASAPAATPRPCSRSGWARSGPSWSASGPWRPT